MLTLKARRLKASFRAAVVGAVLVAVWAGWTAGASAADTPYHWIWVSPTAAGWETLEGDTVLAFSGHDFTATLKGHGTGYEPTLLVHGHTHGDRVEATLVQEGTDAAPRRYAGRIQATRTKPSDPSGGWGDERISLTDGPFFLGFHLTLSPSAAGPP